MVIGILFILLHNGYSVKLKASLRRELFHIPLIITVLLEFLNFKHFLIDRLQNQLIQAFVDKPVGLWELIFDIFWVAVIPIIQFIFIFRQFFGGRVLGFSHRNLARYLLRSLAFNQQ